MSALSKAVEQSMGLSLDEVLNMPLDEMRAYFEKKNGKKTIFKSEFPFIGRGDVLRDCLVSHEEAEAALDESLKVLGGK